MDLNKIRAIQQQIITRVAIGYNLTYIVDNYPLKDVIQTTVIATDWINPESSGTKTDYIKVFIRNVKSEYPIEEYPELWI